MLEYKLHIALIINILIVIKQLSYNQLMHNLYAIFGKVLNICRQYSSDLFGKFKR